MPNTRSLFPWKLGSGFWFEPRLVRFDASTEDLVFLGICGCNSHESAQFMHVIQLREDGSPAYIWRSRNMYPNLARLEAIGSPSL